MESCIRKRVLPKLAARDFAPKNKVANKKKISLAEESMLKSTEFCGLHRIIIRTLAALKRKKGAWFTTYCSILLYAVLLICNFY